ncbi:MAG: HAMP domain-containing protein [Alphaproteobacteria bacterium]|nr:HAMP domain-containing protein [Alphaproteobacteria bacterium]
MLVVDTEGRVMAVNSVDAAGKSIDSAKLYGKSYQDASWFKKAVSGEFLKGSTLTGTAVEPPHYDAIVADVFKDDGYVMTFSAPIKDAQGKVIGVWANFADFNLVENIVETFYAQMKQKGLTTAAIDLIAPNGVVIAAFDPAEAHSDSYKRDTKVIGVANFAEMGMPGAAVALKEAKGSDVMIDPISKVNDAVGYVRSNGAYDFPGLGWSALVHVPEADLFGSIYSTRQLLFTICAAALVAIAAVGMLIGTLASRPLRKLAVEIGRLSEGDYSRDLEGANRSDEIGSMVKSLNFNVAKIREIVSRIKIAAESVNSAASEIASGSTDLSQRTEQQASSLEETAASMEELTGTVKQNSQNAHNANELSSKASTIANEGGTVVEEAVTAMSNIETSSKKISDIIGVIDEIAFQTNLLALNAAVEAARAGDAGKGFAVVASEVRSLAGRSASASKEIKALINESASQVKTGAELVNRAGDTLKGIVSSVQQVAGIVSEIASASVEQATGIGEVSTAVSQMDEVTQQNAALVEENTAAAQAMVEQAKSLEELMRFFTIGEEEEHEAPRFEQPSKVVPMQKAAKKTPAPVRKSTTVKHAKLGGKGGYDSSWEEF